MVPILSLKPLRHPVWSRLSMKYRATKIRTPIRPDDKKVLYDACETESLRWRAEAGASPSHSVGRGLGRRGRPERTAAALTDTQQTQSRHGLKTDAPCRASAKQPRTHTTVCSGGVKIRGFIFGRVRPTNEDYD